MAHGPDARSITLYHEAFLQVAESASDALDAASGAWPAIAANHRFNCLLWREEDKARRQDVPAGEIAEGKHRIDGYNQRRNDAGAMIDRLSILALKIHHMREQTLRTGAGAAHVDACAARSVRLVTQRTDLAGCLDRLLLEARDGRAYFKVYRQFKIYNDPALNPYLYGGARVAQGRGRPT